MDLWLDTLVYATRSTVHPVQEAMCSCIHTFGMVKGMSWNKKEEAVVVLLVI
jgi:hypothetical protein